jgi:hypothetical protein
MVIETNCPSERLIILDFARKTEGNDNGMAGDATDAAAPAHWDERIDDPIFDH